MMVLVGLLTLASSGWVQKGQNHSGKWRVGRQCFRHSRIGGFVGQSRMDTHTELSGVFQVGRIFKDDARATV